MSKGVPTGQQTNKHPTSFRYQGGAKAGIQLTLQQPLLYSRNRCKTAAEKTSAVEAGDISALMQLVTCLHNGANLWHCVYVQLMQQRARKAAVRAMATVCAAIPKPDSRDPDLLGADIKKTAVGLTEHLSKA